MSVGSSTPQAAASRAGSAGTLCHGGDRGLRVVRKSERIATDIGRARNGDDGIAAGCVDGRRRHVRGGLGGASGRSERRVSDPDPLDGCTTDDEVCGELEYGDPSGADQVFCASELTRTGLEGDVLALSERIVYHPWMCMAAPSKCTRRPTGASRSNRSSGTARCAARERSPTSARRCLPRPPRNSES